MTGLVDEYEAYTPPQPDDGVWLSSEVIVGAALLAAALLVGGSS